MKSKKECLTEYRNLVNDQFNPYRCWMERCEKKPHGDYVTQMSYRTMTINQFASMKDLNEIVEDVLIIVGEHGEIDSCAFGETAFFLDNSGYDFAYADEDYLLGDSCLGDYSDLSVLHQIGVDVEFLDPKHTGRVAPFFKPDYSPETLLSFNYFGNFFACKVNALREAGVTFLDGAPADEILYDAFLKLSEKVSIGHISKILFHNYKLPSDAKLSGQDERFDKVKLAALERRGISSCIERDSEGYAHFIYEIKENPKVSVLIPSKDHPDLVKQCVGSLKKLTDYDNYEIILIDNGSNEENKSVIDAYCNEMGVNYLYRPQEFNFSALCNQMAEEAGGEILLFLNDDIEITDASWMRKMLGELQKKEVGAVGAKLLYPNSKIIQHCGISNAFVGPVHRLQMYSDEYSYYYGRNKVEYNYIGATAACLMMKKSVFNEVGRFCESIRVAYNDVDLCFRIFEAGYRQVVRSDVVLYHHESISRGKDDAGEKKKRLDSERRSLYERHPALSPDRMLEGGEASIDPYCPNMQQWSRSSLFSPEFLYDYENRTLLSKVTRLSDVFPLTPKGIIDRSMVLLSIDEREVAENYNSFSGWTLLTKKDNALFMSTVLLFGENGKRYAITPFRTMREDVAKYIEGQTNILMSGIRVRVKKGDLPIGRYRVGAIFDCMTRDKRYAMLSDEYWEITE